MSYPLSFPVAKTQAIVAEAIAAAEAAGAAKLAELEGAGPRWAVVDEMQPSRPVVGTMLDVCGGAYLTLRGCNAGPAKWFLQSLRKLATQQTTQRSYRSGYECDGLNFFVHKGYPTGYTIHLRTSIGMRQEMGVATAAANAAAEVLKSYGVPVGVRSYID